MDLGIQNQINDIEKNIMKLSSHLARRVAENAEEDLTKARSQIINDFYSYQIKTPSKNKRTNLLGRVVKIDKMKGSGNGTFSKYTTSLSVDGGRVQELYGHGSVENRVSAEYVTDLIWFEGIRGLPQSGSSGVSNSFSWYTPDGRQSYTQGEHWHNPFWDESVYENTFRTSVKLYNLKTITDTPDKVMEDFVDKWGRQRLQDILNKVNKELKKF